MNCFLKQTKNYQAPSKVERDKVKRSVDEPIQLNYLKTQKKLSPSLVEEALTLSDLFNLNECSSVELLTEAEDQMQYFHGFNRGLTAVLLYYDSKKIIVNNLKTLIMARTGRTWVLDENIPHEITNFIDNYVNKLLQNGMVAKILSKILTLKYEIFTIFNSSFLLLFLLLKRPNRFIRLAES